VASDENGNQSVAARISSLERKIRAYAFLFKSAVKRLNDEIGGLCNVLLDVRCQSPGNWDNNVLEDLM
jgi:hypothetical protein